MHQTISFQTEEKIYSALRSEFSVILIYRNKFLFIAVGCAKRTNNNLCINVAKFKLNGKLWYDFNWKISWHECILFAIYFSSSFDFFRVVLFFAPSLYFCCCNLILECMFWCFTNGTCKNMTTIRHLEHCKKKGWKCNVKATKCEEERKKFNGKSLRKYIHAFVEWKWSD